MYSGERMIATFSSHERRGKSRQQKAGCPAQAGDGFLRVTLKSSQ